jgi:hypothetical protein
MKAMPLFLESTLMVGGAKKGASPVVQWSKIGQADEMEG